MTMTTTKRKNKIFHLSLPPGLIQILKGEAHKRDWSMNKTIVNVVKNWAKGDTHE